MYGSVMTTTGLSTNCDRYRQVCGTCSRTVYDHNNMFFDFGHCYSVAQWRIDLVLGVD